MPSHRCRPSTIAAAVAHSILPRVLTAAPRSGAAGDHGARRGVTVRGRVVDDRSGAPVRGAGVRAYAAGSLRPPVQTDATGSFAVTDLPFESRIELWMNLGPYNERLTALKTAAERPLTDLGTIRHLIVDWKSVGWMKLPMAERGLTGIDSELRDGKLLIIHVRPDTPAERAGLAAGERVVSIDGKSMDGLAWASRDFYLQGYPGTRLAVVVQDPSGKTRRVVIRREKPPARPPAPATSSQRGPIAQPTRPRLNRPTNEDAA